MRLDHIHSVYFVGIGGIGMSALARWFMHYGKKVAGYDKTSTPLTDELKTEGADIHFTDDLDEIPEVFKHDRDRTLVIYTPAIPVGHRELAYFREKGYSVMKRAEVLGWISKEMYTIAIAGTHGKTTTSSMIAHLLKVGGISFTALVGGILTNYNANFVINGSRPEIFVVEADEFDRSFLQLSPDMAVITSMDADHLDIYGDHEELHHSFKAFVNKLSEEGKLFCHQTLDSIFKGSRSSVVSYGGKGADVSSAVSHITKGITHFTWSNAEENIDLSLRLPGRYNIDNATAAAQVAIELGVDVHLIKAGFENYSGVKRRFEHIISTDDHVLIDDYAHHPTEISAFISGVRSIYPKREITVVFQPHLYTRTRDFAVGFANSLSMADRVVLLDIYPAREEPITGVTSEMIFEKITVTDKRMCSKENLMQVIGEISFDVLCTVGAGDIDQLIKPLKEHIETVKV